MTSIPRDRNRLAEGSLRECVPEDVPRLLELIRALAEYERLSHAVSATADSLADGLFGPDAVAEALLAEREGEALGYALFFPTFSTFLANRGLWLEDLFVVPAHRGSGIGRALLQAVALRALERGCARVEWEALDWNAPALGFYERLGAITRPDWITHRLDGDALVAVAEARR